MSPIDRELERTLAQRASGLTPPGDLLDGVEREARGIRRRRSAVVGTAALSVLAIVIAVPLATRNAGNDDRDPGTGFVTAPPSAAASPAPSATPSPTASGQPEFALGWDPRGPLAADAARDERIIETMTKEFAEPPHSSFNTLWAGPLPDGRVVAVFESLTEPAFTHFYVEMADGSGGRLVQRRETVDRNPQGPAEGKRSRTRLPQVSAYVDGPQDFVVIIGAPTTGELEFSTDGRRYTTVEFAEGTGIVAVTRGEDRTAFRVRVFDGDGVAVYDGPIDLLSED